MDRKYIENRIKNTKTAYFIAKQIYHYVRTFFIILILTTLFVYGELFNPYITYSIAGLSILSALAIVVLVWFPNPMTPAVRLVWEVVPRMEKIEPLIS